MRRQRQQHVSLIAQEALAWRLTGGPMNPRIGDGLEPVRHLGLKVAVAQKLAAVEKTVAQVADRALHFPLGLRAIRPTGADAKPPVGGEAQELRIFQELAAAGALVRDDHGAHLIEQQLLRHAAERGEGGFQSRHHRLHRLARIELEPQEPRVAEDHHQGKPFAPGKPDLGEINLRLMTRWRLEADHRLWLGSRPHAAHEHSELGQAPGIARGLTLRK